MQKNFSSCVKTVLFSCLSLYGGVLWEINPLDLKVWISSGVSGGFILHVLTACLTVSLEKPVSLLRDTSTPVRSLPLVKITQKILLCKIPTSQQIELDIEQMIPVINYH